PTFLWVPSTCCCSFPTSFSSSRDDSGRLKLGDGHRQPFDALTAEIHLHARIAAVALGVDDHAGAEFRVRHVLADTKAHRHSAAVLEETLLLLRRGRKGRRMELPALGEP